VILIENREQFLPLGRLERVYSMTDSRAASRREYPLRRNDRALVRLQMLSNAIDL